MSVAELESLARRHWKEWLPERYQWLKANGTLNEELRGAALLAQKEIEHLMERGYQEHEAREVALPMFILLAPEPPDEDDEQERELAEMEREYQKNPMVQVIR